MAYITIPRGAHEPDAVFIIDTIEGEQKARDALRECQWESASIYAGNPDDESSYATGQLLFASRKDQA
jgi:hypothetical protein